MSEVEGALNVQLVYGCTDLMHVEFCQCCWVQGVLRYGHHYSTPLPIHFINQHLQDWLKEISRKAIFNLMKKSVVSNWLDDNLCGDKQVTGWSKTYQSWKVNSNLEHRHFLTYAVSDLCNFKKGKRNVIWNNTILICRLNLCWWEWKCNEAKVAKEYC